MINARRENLLWLLVRFTSLIVFGVLPLVLVIMFGVDLHYRVKHRAFRERFDYCISHANHATQVHHFHAADMWLNQADAEAVKFFGPNYTNR